MNFLYGFYNMAIEIACTKKARKMQTSYEHKFMLNQNVF